MRWMQAVFCWLGGLGFAFAGENGRRPPEVGEDLRAPLSSEPWTNDLQLYVHRTGPAPFLFERPAGVERTGPPVSLKSFREKWGPVLQRPVETVSAKVAEVESAVGESPIVTTSEPVSPQEPEVPSVLGNGLTAEDFLLFLNKRLTSDVEVPVRFSAPVVTGSGGKKAFSSATLIEE